MLRSAPLTIIIPLLLSACSGDEKDAWGGTVETRPDGVVVVRNPEKGAWPAGAEWRMEEDLRIGTATGQGPALFGEVAAVEADSLGRVWVLDRQARQLRVFDARGKHVRTIGREGEGPGEFRDPIALAWAPDGTMWVVDPGAARFTVFDTAGLFIATHPRRVAGYSVPWRGAFGSDGLLYEIAMVPGATPGESRMSLLRFDAGMEPADTFALPDHRGEQYELRDGGTTRIAAAVPFTAGHVMGLDPRGFVWTGVNDRYRLARMRTGAGGDTVLIVERESPPVPVTAAERDEAVAGMKWFTDQGGRVDAGRIPGTKPAFEQVVVDLDGGIWVRPALAAGTAGAAFDVFDAEGRYGGRVRLPGGMERFPQPVIRGGAMYGVANDSLGVPYVVRARIVRGESRAG
jgi:sugar lactone lactonase YvrE